MQKAIQAVNERHLFALIVWLLLPCVGCSSGPAAVAETIDDVDASADRASAIRRGGFRNTLLLTGELRARYGEEIIVPRLPSWETTIRWMVEDGSFVVEGDRLVELDTAQIASELENKITAREEALHQLASKRAEIDGQLAQKRFQVARAETNLRKAEIDTEVPEDIQTRKKFQEAQLAFDQAQVEYDKAMADFEGYELSSSAEIEIAQIQLARTEREVAEARRAIETMVLRAPQSGIAVAAEYRREQRKYQVGDPVSVGSRVMEIPDLSEMMIEARLSDVDDGKIAPGMLVTCTLDAYPAREFIGRILSISPVAQEAGRRSLQHHFLVHIDLDETDPEIMRPGMSAKVVVETARREDAVLVPRSALVFADEQVLLRQADGSTVPVTLGSCNAMECVLEQGPESGTAVGVGR